MTRTTLAAAGAVVGLLAVVLVLQLRRPSSLSPGRTVVVYNAISGDLSLVEDAAGAPHRRTLGCARPGKWAVRVGATDGKLVMLDTEQRALVTIDLAAIAAGCRDGTELPARRVPLHAGKLPMHGLIVGERLYVTYFSDNLIESYRWPSLAFESALHLDSPENLGLSDLDAAGTTLLVAAAGYVCFERHCPGGRFRAPHLYFLDAARPLPPSGPLPEARPANLNTNSVLARPPFVLNAGDFEGGYGSLQRIAADRSLGPEIKLPRGAGPSLARVVGETLVVTQMSGEHLFVIDTSPDRLRAILRFDGRGFSSLPLDTPALAERSSADFQDILVDKQVPDRLYLVDAKGERLVRAHFSSADATLTVESVTSLATEAHRSTPNWAVWLN